MFVALPSGSPPVRRPLAAWRPPLPDSNVLCALPQEENCTGPPGPGQAQHSGLGGGGAGDWEIAQGCWTLGPGPRGGGSGAHDGGKDHGREVTGRVVGHWGGRWHQGQDEAAVTGIGLQDGGERKDRAVRGIFNTEQGVLAAVTCTKEKEQSRRSTHSGKGHQKSLHESKLKNCSSRVAPPGVMGPAAPSLDPKVRRS